MYLLYGANSVEVPIIKADISKLIIFHKVSKKYLQIKIFHRSLM